MSPWGNSRVVDRGTSEPVDCGYAQAGDLAALWFAGPVVCRLRGWVALWFISSVVGQLRGWAAQWCGGVVGTPLSGCPRDGNLVRNIPGGCSHPGAQSGAAAMELTNEFRVSVPVDQAWQVLTDLERIAPCMPGAQLQEVEGDEYRGSVKVKVGPITAQYKGVARFVERDEEARRAVLRAEGRDTRGQGTASATVTAVLIADGEGTAAEGTTVSIVTDLSITGKVAQFGRGVLGDVSARILDQFARQLESDVLAAGGTSAHETEASVSAPSGTSTADSGTHTAASGSQGSGSSADGAAATSKSGTGAAPSTDAGASPTVRSIPDRPVEPVDLLGVAGSSLARRLVPLGAGALALLLLAAWVRYSRRR